MILNHQEIADRIPHAGSMCLLHTVSFWDKSAIKATALSHRESGNPLRCSQGLGIVAGIEYAAQAIAVHGNLISGNNGARPGRLVSTRSIKTRIRWLHLIEGELLIMASKIVGDDSGMIYDFVISSGENHLLSGRVSIALI